MRAGGLVVGLAVAATGCASYGTMTSARPVAPGASQITAALELDAVGVQEDDLRVPLPSLAVGVRRGVRADVDVGGKVSVLPLGDALTQLGVEGQVRWRIAGDADATWEVAVAPSAGWRGISSSGARWDAAHVALPVIVGLNFGRRRHQLFASPKVGYQRWWSAGSMPVGVPFAGAGIGLSWRIKPRLTLVPEATALSSPTSLDQSEAAAIVHVGIGLVWEGH